MTSIVGVLNKHAVAIAADSAVTIGGKKVFNSKIKSSLYRNANLLLLLCTITLN